MHCQRAQSWLEDLIADLRHRLPHDTGPHTQIAQQTLDAAQAQTLRQKCAAVWNLSPLTETAPFDDTIRNLIDGLERKWHQDEITLLEALDAFWALRRILDARIAPNITASPDAPSALLYVPEPEAHTFGAQLLTDQLQRVGLSATLMAQSPKAELFEALAHQPYDLLALSIGYDQSLSGLADFIAQVRIVSANRQMRVAVGGRVFEKPAPSYAFLGADIVVLRTEDAAARITASLRQPA